MTIHSATAEDLDQIPLTPIEVDWFGDPVLPSARFGFGLDCEFLHFVAQHDRPARVHPQSRLGEFQAELWKYDVAEFFLTDPAAGHYLEFNLAPNGGWWSCEFTAPLDRRFEVDRPLPGVHIAAAADSRGWTASASLPLAWLQENLHFGPASRLNATFILASPNQRFLTATPLGAGDPAFHRPEAFPPLHRAPNF